MRAFAELFETLDRTGSTLAKVAALRAYFEEAPAGDAAWGLAFLSGQKLKRLVPGRALRSWCRRRSGVSRELFGECYSAVGDLAETVALLIDASAAGDAGGGAAPPLPSLAPRADEQLMLADLGGGDGTEEADSSPGLAAWVEDRLLTLRGLETDRQIALIDRWSRGLSATELFLLMKMLTGAMRIGVSRTLVERALAESAGVEQSVIAHRLSGDWTPSAAAMARLLSPDAGEADLSRPYPFFLASPVVPAEIPPETTELALIETQLGSAGGWVAEWKWDGIRAQLIRREGRVFLWSRGDENLTQRFPEVTDAAARWARDGVLDGELICWEHERDRPRDFGALQRRIGRDAVTPAVLAGSPAVFIAYDLLELDGVDRRDDPLELRLGVLDEQTSAIGSRAVRASERWTPESWAAAAARRSESRERGVEGLMLKRAGSVYQSGRRRGDWWKWKIDPMTIDAVLVYAQPGHGRRAGLLTDYSFAVWDEKHDGSRELVTVAKAYSGLSDEEFVELDRWLRKHTTERFGPVRGVRAEQVFELAFEGIRRSDRHRSGIAFRFPRMKRWRKDKAAADADTLSRVEELLPG